MLSKKAAVRTDVETLMLSRKEVRNRNLVLDSPQKLPSCAKLFNRIAHDTTIHIVFVFYA